MKPTPIFNVTNLLALRFSTPAWLIAVTLILLIAATMAAVAGVATAKNNQITLEKIASLDNEKDTEIWTLKQINQKWAKRVRNLELGLPEGAKTKYELGEANALNLKLMTQINEANRQHESNMKIIIELNAMTFNLKQEINELKKNK